MASTIKEIKNPWLRTLAEYGLITVSIWIMVIGIYFFKFPNHFAFGGVTGFSTVFSQLLHCSASTFTTAANYALLVLGFIFLGKSVGVRTVYATIVMSVSLQALDALVPMHGTLTDQPMLELVFAIMLPAIGSAILFNIDASSGGTDVIAMILKKYTSMNIGSALMAADVAAVGLSFAMYGPSTGLFSMMGLVAKSMVVDIQGKMGWLHAPVVYRLFSGRKDYDCICHNFAGHFPVRNYFHTDRNTCRARHSRHEKTAPDHLSRRDQYSASECGYRNRYLHDAFVCEIY